MNTVKDLLPDTYPIYLYSYPRVSTDGVTWHYNEYESETRRAYTESYLLTFDQLRDVVDQDGAFYQALQTPYVRPASTVAGFSDVSITHWAASYIQAVADAGLMEGAGGLFRPDAPITAAEACATVVRSQQLPAADTPMAGLPEDAWYTPEVSAAYAAGLLDGLADDFQPTAAISRADAMQLFANALVRQGSQLPDEQTVGQMLAAYTDADSIPAEQRAAVVLCMQNGLISGYPDGTLRPNNTLTRSEFAKLLTVLPASA